MRATLLVVTAVLAIAACGENESGHTVPTDVSTPVVAVTLADTGCNPTDFTLGPGPVIFRVTNPGAKVTEMEVQDAQGHVINDVEGVTAGHTRSFVVNLISGTTYRVRCPETAKTGGQITVK